MNVSAATTAANNEVRKIIFLPSNENYPIHYSEPKAYHRRMRVMLVLLAVALLLIEFGGRIRSSATAINPKLVLAASPSAPKAHVDFDTQVKPMLQSTCRPCHFSGGQMYERLPFDKPATIRQLGTRLFTRIKEEDKRRLLEDFLAQSP